MASEPTTPVRVSKSAANYTPTTQDADLRSQINSILLKDGHVAKYVFALPCPLSFQIKPNQTKPQHLDNHSLLATESKKPSSIPYTPLPQIGQL